MSSVNRKHWFKWALATMITMSMVNMSTPAHSVTKGHVPPSHTVAESIVQLRTNYASCTGTMISDQWVLTAKHCVNNDEDNPENVTSSFIEVIHGDDVYYSVNSYSHPDGDIALAKIVGNYEGTVAQLPSEMAVAGDIGKFAGFGGNDRVEEVDIAISQIVFTNFWNDTDRIPSGKIGEDGLLRYLKVDYSNGEVRPGDSGGPLFIGNEVRGVLAYGYHDENGVVQKPHYTGVTYVIDWIRDITGITGENYETIESYTSNTEVYTETWEPTQWELYNEDSQIVPVRNKEDKTFQITNVFASLKDFRSNWF